MPEEYSEWGTVDDVKSLLQTADAYVAAQDAYLQIALDAAKAKWLEDVRHAPFLVAAAAEYSERKFDMLGGLVNFDTGLLELESISIYGEVAEEGEFTLKPANAVAKGKPYTYAEYYVPATTAGLSITISGRWGYCTVIPADAWNAVLMKAAQMIVTGAAMGSGLSGAVAAGQMKKKTDDDVSVEYTTGGEGQTRFSRGEAAQATIAFWEAAYQAALNNHKLKF